MYILEDTPRLSPVQSYDISGKKASLVGGRPHFCKISSIFCFRESRFIHASRLRAADKLGRTSLYTKVTGRRARVYFAPTLVLLCWIYARPDVPPFPYTGFYQNTSLYRPCGTLLEVCAIFFMAPGVDVAFISIHFDVVLSKL